MRTHGILLGGALAVALGSPAVAANLAKPAMHVDATHERVSFPISLGVSGPNGGFNIDGYGTGHMTITVPLGWTVSIKATNVSDLPHSLEVADTQAKLPLSAVAPAFPGGETIDVKSGLSPNSSASFSFKADRAGRYWIMCGVPGHAAGGMWDWFVVSKTATSPTVTVRNGAAHK